VEEETRLIRNFLENIRQSVSMARLPAGTGGSGTDAPPLPYEGRVP
jgi:hypothetical protein